MGVYKRLLELYSQNSDRFFVYLNEYSASTFLDSGLNLVPEL